MRRAETIVVAAAVFALALFGAGDARASTPVNVEAGVIVGYATNPGTREPADGSPGPNPLGVGLGARGGFEFWNHVYAGAEVIDYYGSTRQDSVGSASSESAFLLGVDAGYTFHLAFLSLRPEIGLGEATLTDTSYLTLDFYQGTQSFTESTTHLYLDPKLTMLVNLAFVYVGMDAGLLTVFDVDQQGSNDTKTFASFAFHGQLGARF